MKKFISLVLALIVALSVATVAFAASAFECGVCHAVFTDEKTYTAHMNSGCLEQYKDCQYCKAKVANDNHEAHELNCPKGAGKCEYCGEGYATQAAYAEHKANDCKMISTVGSEDTAKIVNKILDFLKSVDWKGLVDKVVGVVKGIDFKGIIEKIKPVIEKVTPVIEEALGEIELPAASK